MTQKRTQAKPPAAEPRKRARPSKRKAPEVVVATVATVAPEAKRDRVLVGPALFFSPILVVVLAVGAAAAFFVLRSEDSPENLQAGVSTLVSAPMLAAQDAPVYWAGPMPSRRLELTTTRTGTFVRYLPEGVVAGDSSATFTTIATYPLRDSYETAVRRGTEPGMVSREMPGGGVAVWSRAEPTSVYLAYPRVPQLVEVYALRPDEARRLALSGRVRPAS